MGVSHILYAKFIRIACSKLRGPGDPHLSNACLDLLELHKHPYFCFSAAFVSPLVKAFFSLQFP